VPHHKMREGVVLFPKFPPPPKRPFNAESPCLERQGLL
jgi:hypothetical protein